MRSSKWKFRTITGFLLSSAMLLTSSSWCWPGSPRQVEAAAVTSSQTQSALQSALLNKLNLRSDSFSLQVKGNVTTAAMKSALQAVMAQDDYLKYAIRSYQYSIQTGGKNATISVHMKYWENAEQTAYVKARSKQILAEIIQPGMNAHQKVKAIHDWVLLHVAYDQTLVKHSAYDALKTGQAVCQGYASLTYRLLTDAGIRARIVEGTAHSVAHAWNLVQLDGNWYQLDTTFDDPVPDVKGRTTYGYYLVTDKQLKEDHRWTGTYPAAVTSYGQTLEKLKAKDAARDTFYAALEDELGLQYLDPAHTAGTLDEIAKQIRQAAAAGQSAVTMRYTDDSAGGPNLKALIKLMPELASVEYTMTTFALGNPGDSLLTLTFTVRQ